MILLWKRQEFGQKSSSWGVSIWYARQQEAITILCAPVACLEDSLAVGVWVASIVNLWTRLVRVQINCCINAFYSRWFVDEQVVTPTFNLGEVKHMDLTNKRRWQRAGKGAQGEGRAARNGLYSYSVQPRALTWPEAQFLSSGSCQQLGERD